MSNGYTPEGDVAVKEKTAKPAAKRGRPPRQAEEKQRRRKRTDMSLGRLSPLDLPEEAKDPNYYYRWIDAAPGRVRQLTVEDDYDIVTQDQLLGDDNHSEKEVSNGSQVERSAERSSDARMVLVRKPKELYDVDYAAQQARVDEIDNIIRRGGTESPEGLHGANAYVPDGGINISRKG